MTAKTVLIERRLQASVGEVWDALTGPDQLAGWLGRGSLEPVEGGSVDLMTAGRDGGHVVGVVRRYDPPRLLELTWSFESEPETLVRFELEPRGDGTLLRLSHIGLPAELHDDYRHGWAHYLNALARLIGAPRENQLP